MSICMPVCMYACTYVCEIGNQGQAFIEGLTSSATGKFSGAALGTPKSAERRVVEPLPVQRLRKLLLCVLQCVAVCCSVLQCVAVCCSAWQCVVV